MSQLIMVEQPTLNKDKYLEVLHYIIHKCDGLESAGKTVIFKILYFSDFDYYEEFEEFLTGEEYCKLPHGPAPCNFDAQMKVLVARGLVKPIKSQFGGMDQQKFISLGKPELKTLSAEELRVVDRTIGRLGSMNATQISAYSHKDIPWEAAPDKGIIDYEMVFYRDELTSVRTES